jgi:hypothetical protein
MSDYEPLHDQVSGQFTEQKFSVPEKPIVPGQYRIPASSAADRIRPCFEQFLSGEQEDRFLRSAVVLGSLPFIQPASVKMDSGMPGPTETCGYFVDDEDGELIRIRVDADGSVTGVELFEDEGWTDVAGGGVWEDVRDQGPEDADTRNSFSDALTEVQDRILLRFNDFEYGLNTSTRPDGNGGVEAINISTDNDDVRRIRINAEGFVTSIATLDISETPAEWVEWNADSDAFEAISNDRMSNADLLLLHADMATGVSAEMYVQRRTEINAASITRNDPRSNR